MQRLRRATDSDCPAVAELYCQAFPERATRVLAAAHSESFWTDYFALQGTLHPATFLVADVDGGVAGFLLVTCPGRALRLQAVWQLLGLLGSLVVGRYGPPLRVAPRLLSALSPSGPKPPQPLRALAHLEAIAVKPAHAGHGIGRELLREARRVGSPFAEALWLRVESDNASAIRLYEGFGMTDCGGTERERWMVWRWRDADPVSSADA